MLSPKKVKYRKQMRNRSKGIAWKGGSVSFGSLGLYSTEPGKISNRVIEAARVAINRKLKRGGKLWIRIFPDYPFTKKPAEVRMGKGKGAPEGWSAIVRPGRILYEMEGVPEELAREALRLAAHKLPIQTRFVVRSEI